MPVIVLEGSNGTGTSTQCSKLKDHLESLGKNVILTRHPGSTELGKELRKILKFGNVKTTPQQEILLFAADALSFYQEYITKYNKNDFIICDRLNITGALTYQKAGGATEDQIIAMFNVLGAMGWHKVFDQLFIFRAPYDILQSRLEKPDLIDQDKEQGNKKDRFESRGNTFMEDVCENYHKLSDKKVLKNYFNNISNIDASDSIDGVFSQIIRHLIRNELI